MAGTTPKKPSNQKGKSVYFNLDDPGELRLYEYAMNIKNFSGYMKAKLYADMIQNNGQAPNPYIFLGYDSVMTESRLSLVSNREVAATTTHHATPERVSKKVQVLEPENNNEDNPIDSDERENEKPEVKVNINSFVE